MAADPLNVLPAGYRRLVDGAVAVLSADERVQAAWLHGSVARGDADALSDVDMIVAVADDGLASFGEDWRERLAAITPTVMARRFPGPSGSWLAITPDCERFDLWVEAAGAVPTSVVRHRVALFDRAGLDARLPPPDPPAPPSAAKLDALREWEAACRAVASVAASDDVLGIEVVHALRWILYEACVEANRPIPVSGLKQWSAKLTKEQRATLEGLPTRGDPAPVLAALDDTLGPPTTALPTTALPTTPELARVLLPPEGSVRALSLLGQPRPARLRHIAEEFFALHLYLTVVVHRADWLLGVEGVHILRKLLYELDLEERGRPAARSPADWSGRLNDEQRGELLELPTGDASRDGVIGGHRAVREAFVRRGRRVLGEAWPSAMEAAVVTHVDAFVASA